MGIPNQVAVSCAICETAFTVKASRATQSKEITCSPACIAELRSRNVIAYRGSAETRLAKCATCSVPMQRKPSQIAKYAKNYCGRECAAAGKLGVNYKPITGKYLPCDNCGELVWRTPATLRKQVFCSMSCAAVGKRRLRGPRVLRVVKQCNNGCGKTLRMLPSVDAIGRRFCSVRCAHQTIQGARRGLPGRKWPAEQRQKLTATLRQKYNNEWSHFRIRRSLSMSGKGNPRYRDGRTLRPYAPGFTDRVKMQVIKRDNFKCRLCGAPRLKGTHVVHHIDGEKWDHSLENLILLCKPCHGKTHARMDRERSLGMLLNSQAG